jgi:hypothetical protein
VPRGESRCGKVRRCDESKGEEGESKDSAGESRRTVGVEEVQDEEQGTETDYGGGACGEARLGRERSLRDRHVRRPTDGEVEVGNDGEEETDPVPSTVFEFGIVRRVGTEECPERVEGVVGKLGENGEEQTGKEDAAQRNPCQSRVFFQREEKSLPRLPFDPLPVRPDLPPPTYNSHCCQSEPDCRDLQTPHPDSLVALAVPRRESDKKTEISNGGMGEEGEKRRREGQEERSEGAEKESFPSAQSHGPDAVKIEAGSIQ